MTQGKIERYHRSSFPNGRSRCGSRIKEPVLQAQPSAEGCSKLDGGLVFGVGSCPSGSGKINLFLDRSASNQRTAPQLSE